MQAIELLTAIADLADPIALARFRSPLLTVMDKEDGSQVTDADLEIEKAARALVAREAPGLGVLGEEFGDTPGDGDARLIIDPIDATANLVRGIPAFATLLALEQSGTLVAALVSAPALGLRWSATRGGGAWRNGEPIRVSGRGQIADAQMFNSGITAEVLAACPGFLSLVGRVSRQRGFGDFWQHLLVAEGAGEFAVDVGLKPWDIAALQLIVEEAGGRATGLDGSGSIYAGSLISSNGLLHEAVLAALRDGSGR